MLDTGHLSRLRRTLLPLTFAIALAAGCTDGSNAQQQAADAEQAAGTDRDGVYIPPGLENDPALRDAERMIVPPDVPLIVVPPGDTGNRDDDDEAPVSP